MSAQWIYGDTEPVGFEIGADLTGATVRCDVHPAAGRDVAPVATAAATTTGETGRNGGSIVTVNLSALDLPAPSPYATYVLDFTLTRGELTQTTDAIQLTVKAHATS